MIVVGIDVGSVSTKAVLMDEEKIIKQITPTGWSPKQAGADIFEQLLKQVGYSQDQVDCVVGTGYGRISLQFADKVVTEITCHARGAAYLDPQSGLVIDIGGQDSKVIKIDSDGRVLNFLMNDKCAAGTGRFLQVIANAVGVDVSELAGLSDGQNPIPINSMCTVFAESEVIGLLAEGKTKGAIVAGIHLSIARRIANMAKRLGPADKVTFTGGVAKNDGVRLSLQKELGVPVFVPGDCQITGAIGAALIGRDLILRQNKE